MKGKNYIILAVISFFATSCSHYYYVPNGQNVPLFREKNDLRLAGNIGWQTYTTSGQFEAAYSFSKNFAATLNYFSVSGEDDYNSGRANMLEGGIGYFKATGKKTSFEVFTGYGGGKQYHNYRDGKSQLTFGRIFLQPAFGYRSKNFEIAFSTRLNSFKISDISSNLLDGNTDSDRLNLLKENSNPIFLEPALTIRLGFEDFKLQFQGIYSENLSEENSQFELFDKGYVSAGIYFFINTAKNK